MKSLVLWFILNNLLISLPFYFYNFTFSYASFVFVLFFTFLWLSVNFINKILITEKSKESDIALISFAVNVGFKFLMSLFFLGFVIYYYQSIDVKLSVLLFVFYYFQYTYLIAKFGRNKVL